MSDQTERRFGRTAHLQDAEPMARLRQLTLPASISGALWLTGLPDSDVRLRRFLDETAAQSISQLVILTEDHEIRDLAPAYERLLLSSGLAFSVMRLPIRDFDVPESVLGFRREAQRISKALERGERIVVHCRGGIGRTGMMACAVLCELGMQIDEAIGLVAAAGSKCETAEQTAFLLRAFGNAKN